MNCYLKVNSLMKKKKKKTVCLIEIISTLKTTISKNNGEFIGLSPPYFNKGELFNKISNPFSKSLKSYDNIVLAGVLNNHLLDSGKGHFKSFSYSIRCF